MKKLFLVSATTLTLFVSVECLAVIQLSGLLGLANTSQSASSNLQNLSVASRTGFTYGVFGDFKFPDSGYGLAAGILNVTNFTHQTYGPLVNDLDVKIPYWQLPVTIQSWFMDFFNLGLGFYYAFPGGNVTNSGTASGLPVSSSTDFGTAGIKNDDYGLVANAAVFFPVGTLSAITARIMYEYGLENIATSSGNSVHNTALLFYAGMAFGL